MLNFVLICCLFALVIILFAQLSGVKSRLRVIESLLAKQLKTKAEEVHPLESPTVKSVMPEAIIQPSTGGMIKPNVVTGAAVNSASSTQQSFFTSLFDALYNFFTGGNSFVRIGMLVLFIGIAFLLKYAAQIGYFPVEVRLSAVAILAIGLFVTGFLLEKKRFVYAITLEGGGFAILYLVCFASYYHYRVLTADITFAILVLITALTIIWAIKRNVKTLAVMGIIGGFIAPLLINTSQPNAVILFGYYLILNIGIFITAWFRNWRPLNILGFIFTFVITALWYWHGYSEHDFYVAEVFLFIFFAFYLIVALLTAFKQPPNLQGFIEGSLVFGLPAVTFALQANLFNYHAYPLAITAISLGCLYATLSIALFYFANKALSILAYAFAAIAIVFFTAAIPLLLSGEWTSSIWALEATALIWVGIKQQRYLVRLGGIIIGFLANLYFMIDYPVINHLSWFSNEVLNNILLTVTNLLSAYFLFFSSTSIKQSERVVTKIFFTLGALWWLAAIYHAALFYFSSEYQDSGLLLLTSISALLALALEKRSGWAWYKIISFSLLPIMILLAINQHFFYGWISTDQSIGWYWCIGFLVWYFILWIHRNTDSQYLNFGHVGSYVLMTWLISWYSSQSFLNSHYYSDTWVWCVWGVVPSLFLLVIHFLLGFIKQFFIKFFSNYSEILSIGFVIYILFWVISGNLQLEGTATPWQYLLLLNPLDLSCIIALVIVTLRCFQGSLSLVKTNKFEIAIPCYAIAIISFIWANAMILRFLHFNYAVPFSTEGFLTSQLTQVVLSLFWGVIALITTILANQKQWRPIWFVGAVMIAITILKLFIIDLSNSGTLERIIAFISVGIILLLIGYFAPLPPKSTNN